MMRLKVILPTQVLLDQPVRKVIAQGETGAFCLLPHHIDWLSSLVPGILLFETPEGIEQYVAIDEGILVKCGDWVRVSTRHGVQGNDLTRLRQMAEQKFQAIDEREQLTRSALAQLEANLARQFMQLWG